MRWRWQSATFIEWIITRSRHSIVIGGKGHAEYASRVVVVDGGVVRSILLHFLCGQTWAPPCARNDSSHLLIHDLVAFGCQMKSIAAGDKEKEEQIEEV